MLNWFKKCFIVKVFAIATKQPVLITSEMDRADGKLFIK